MKNANPLVAGTMYDPSLWPAKEEPIEWPSGGEGPFYFSSAPKIRNPMIEHILKIRGQLLEQASDDLKACVAAGVEVEYAFETTEDGGTRITMRTKNPCAVQRINGVVYVYEKRPQE